MDQLLTLSDCLGRTKQACLVRQPTVIRAGQVSLSLRALYPASPPSCSHSFVPFLLKPSFLPAYLGTPHLSLVQAEDTS